MTLGQRLFLPLNRASKLVTVLERKCFFPLVALLQLPALLGRLPLTLNPMLKQSSTLSVPSLILLLLPGHLEMPMLMDSTSTSRRITTMLLISPLLSELTMGTFFLLLLSAHSLTIFLTTLETS